MPTDKFDNQLDDLLKKTLKSHTEPTPPYFTDNVLAQIRKTQEQKILTRVVLQERLALAGGILVSVILIVLAIAFPGIASGLCRQSQIFVGKIAQFFEILNSQWQFYIAFAAVIGFTAYNLVDLLISDR